MNLLKQKKFWIKLIENKIKEVTEEKTKADIKKKYQKYYIIIINKKNKQQKIKKKS